MSLDTPLNAGYLLRGSARGDACIDAHVFHCTILFVKVVLLVGYFLVVALEAIFYERITVVKDKESASGYQVLLISLPVILAVRHQIVHEPIVHVRPVTALHASHELVTIRDVHRKFDGLPAVQNLYQLLHVTTIALLGSNVKLENFDTQNLPIVVYIYVDLSQPQTNLLD